MKAVRNFHKKFIRFDWAVNAPLSHTSMMLYITCKVLVISLLTLLMFCKKGVLRNFIRFTGKHLCRSLFFDKVAGLRPATLLKKRLWHRRFPENFAKFLRTCTFIVHLWWLLLSKPHFFKGYRNRTFSGGIEIELWSKMS